ncbi:hypothetical protein NEISICOT_01303 [Neisseria sicca ATCC 29256]|uniref:Uncharacterized protein n=1 Tax=Neisseria sicca ATCC 29256 TaxID=547045 RepID=C6M461_NEISI|nr:hypothetical protein NEISICOT_01303 [Neisseria sicca ATCC 29256]
MTVSKMPVPTSSTSMTGPQTQPLMVSKKALRLSKKPLHEFLLCLFYIFYAPLFL